MQNDPPNLPSSQGKAPSKSKPPPSKSAAGRPINHLEVKLQQVRMDQISGLDPDIKQFFDDQNLNFQSLPDVNAWTAEAAWWSYTMAPMVLIQRKDGFDVLGSGRAWRVAQLLFQPDDTVGALVLSGVRRIATQTKLQILAAELFGLSADYRTRPKRPQKLRQLWQALVDKGVHCIVGDDIKDFSRATGYSLRALTSGKAPKKAVKVPEQTASDPGRPDQDATPPIPSSSGLDA